MVINSWRIHGNSCQMFNNDYHECPFQGVEDFLNHPAYFSLFNLLDYQALGGGGVGGAEGDEVGAGGMTRGYPKLQGTLKLPSVLVMQVQKLSHVPYQTHWMFRTSGRGT